MDLYTEKEFCVYDIEMSVRPDILSGKSIKTTFDLVIEISRYFISHRSLGKTSYYVSLTLTYGSFSHRFCRDLDLDRHIQNIN